MRIELLPATANSPRSTLSISLNQSIARSALVRFGNRLAASANSRPLFTGGIFDAAWQMPAKLMMQQKIAHKSELATRVLSTVIAGAGKAQSCDAEGGT